MTAEAAPRSRRELSPPELLTRVEGKVQAAGNSVGLAMVEIQRGCSDEDVIDTLHEAINALTVAMLDVAYLQENRSEHM